MSRRIRFLHVADLHLDSPFTGLRSAPQRVAEIVQQATFSTYDRVVETALREQVDFVLIAGDVYDGKDRSLRAQLRFRDGLARLSAAGIDSFIAFGNHDPTTGWSARISWPDGVHRFGSDSVEAVQVRRDGAVLATLYGISHSHAEVRENLAGRLGREQPGGLAIGLLHANVEGIGGHENYAPCRMDDLESAGMDYWALGHVHDRRVLREDMPAVVYPGNTQGRSRAEQGARFCTVVDVAGQGISLRSVAVDAVRWLRREVSITGISDDQELLDALEYSCAEARDVGEGRPVICMIILTGSGPLHDALSRPGYVDGLLGHIQTREVEGEPFMWINRLELATTPELDREERKQALDFVGELLRVADQIRSDPAQIEELKREIVPLQERLQRALRMEFPVDGNRMLEWLDKAEIMCLHLLEGERT